jgi:hypothetical protein
MFRAGCVLLLLFVACSDDSTPVSPAADAAVDAPLTTDPFCKGRPLLPFCEDFDEQALPGAFSEIGGDQALLRVADDPTAPSPPKILTITKTDAAPGSVWLRSPRATRAGKANAFFRVRIEKLDVDVDLGAFAEEAGHRVTMVVTKDGTVGVRVIDPEAGGPALRLSTVKIATGDWASIRWDIRFIDGSARTRLRVGAATAFDAEPIGLLGNDAAERLEIGAEATGAVTLSFDSVTFEPNAE